MAKLINKAQLIRVGVKNPAPDSSRIVIVQLLVAAGIGNDDWAVTPPLGNRVRLLSVDVWMQPTTQGGFIKSFLKVTTGTGMKFTADMISNQWASVMDVSMIVKVGMMLFCCDKHMRFDMSKLYVGESRRFGMYSQSNSNTQYSIIGAFQIAEG